MAKYSGIIGFGIMQETNPSVYEETIVEKKCRGDVLSNYRKFKSVDKINSDIEISNKLSILCDPFISTNINNIRYATYMGVKWKVNSVEVLYPRLILTLGEVYNEQQ